MFRRPCTNCTLLLERQALEWGKSYVFRSCADIHIVEPSVPTGANKCSGHGEWNHEEKVCFCERKRSGKWCQYQHDCQDDSDCMNGGKCTPGGVNPRTKSCFCPFGYFGINCENEPVVQEDTQCFKYSAPAAEDGQFTHGLFNQSCYKKSILSESDFVYSRVVDDQMEIVLDYKTESYVAFGWRPLSIPETCRLFPDLAATALEQSTEAKNAGYLKSALEAPLHPMDCTDIVMASVINGSYLHVEDMYTRDRSTPLRDEVVDGEQSLTAAYGVQRDGRTIVAFRRGIREIEPSDHPLGPGKIFAIYAKGQTPGAYKHVAPSGIDKHARTADTTSFYPNDQFKYHGMKWVKEALWSIQVMVATRLDRWT
ncbi:DOMON domain-containing protein [Aphelenchoides avenae]|nr:DOMON domain-containing protein [Aphelenchus avenae]